MGMAGLPKIVAILLLAIMQPAKIGRLSLFAKLGEASGTTFAYHTPFLLQPLVIFAAHLNGNQLQFIGALSAAIAAVGICTLAHFSLEKTPLKVLLL
jgi:hypothetical protein